MAKKYRLFKRLNLKAKTATAMVEQLVDKTFNDHQRKCWNETTGAFEPSCPHWVRGTLQVARLVELNMTIGVKRAHLDIPCPYAKGDADEQIATLCLLAVRLRDFGERLSHKQCRNAWLLAAEDVEAYAKRNAMEVLAEAVIDRD